MRNIIALAAITMVIMQLGMIAPQAANADVLAMIHMPGGANWAARKTVSRKGPVRHKATTSVRKKPARAGKKSAVSKSRKRTSRTSHIRTRKGKASSRASSVKSVRRPAKATTGGARRKFHKLTAPKRTLRKTKSHKPKKRAYPPGFFMASAPAFDATPASPEVSRQMKHAFANGVAEKYDPRGLVKGGVFKHAPLRGGIFWRREPVKFIVMHSTETARPADARRVIKSWNGRGMSHPGSQYVVDRDGTIYQTVDPDLGTVHVDIFRTRYGVNNDNSIGIEIVRAGKQKYTSKQKQALTRLVCYLQGRYCVANQNIVRHGDIQPSNRTDPVNFDWIAFKDDRAALRSRAMALKGGAANRISSAGRDSHDWPTRINRLLHLRMW
jgi:hypothetical protein